MTNGPLILREFSGIQGRPSSEASYEGNLRECLTAKQGASADGDLSRYGHATRGVAECYRRLGRVRQAELEFRIAADALCSAGDKQGSAWTLLSFSNLQRQKSQFRDSLRTLSRAMVLASTCGDTGLVGYLLAGRAETNRVLGRYPLAMRQHRKALRLFTSLEDARGVVWAHEGIGQMLKNVGLFEQALAHFDDAKRLALKVNDLRGLGYALKCRGECLAALGHPHTAIAEVLGAIHIFRSIGLQVGLGYALKSAGDVLHGCGRHEGALAHYRQAAEVFSESEDARGLAYTFSGLGATCGRLGNARSAVACLGPALRYFAATKVHLGKSQCSSGMMAVIAQHGLRRSKVRTLLDDVDALEAVPQELAAGTSTESVDTGLRLRQRGWHLLARFDQNRYATTLGSPGRALTLARERPMAIRQHRTCALTPSGRR